jgi:hypothetical protein
MLLFTIKSKATRGSVLSTGCFIAIELNYRSGISFWFIVAQSSLGNIASIYVQTLHQPPQESFLLLFFKKEEKITAPS